MQPSVKIGSDAPTGEHFQIELQKTGDSTAHIQFELWHKGHDPAALPPDSNQSFDANDIRASKDSLVCRGSIFIFHPSLTCTINDAQPPKGPFVRVVVGGAPIGNGTHEYPISAADKGKIEQFLSAAKFPPIG
ncbi:MAG: hypothetical protein JO163_05290 [Methylobacteriaceae bacterium]|nr:hypothetical protein [Methylobacteriaceae bacterium]